MSCLHDNIWWAEPIPRTSHVTKVRLGKVTAFTNPRTEKLFKVPAFALFALKTADRFRLVYSIPKRRKGKVGRFWCNWLTVAGGFKWRAYYCSQTLVCTILALLSCTILINRDITEEWLRVEIWVQSVDICIPTKHNVNQWLVLPFLQCPRHWYQSLLNLSPFLYHGYWV